MRRKRIEMTEKDNKVISTATAETRREGRKESDARA